MAINECFSGSSFLILGTAAPKPHRDSLYRTSGGRAKRKVHLHLHVQISEGAVHYKGSYIPDRDLH
jgi:hypothetical protein